MRLEDRNLPQSLDVAAYAEAGARGASELRALLAPLLPTLYTFVARRSLDAEEAEESLGDTLLLARASATRPTELSQPLLPWLLKKGDAGLRSRVGSDPMQELGLGLQHASLPVRIRAGLLQAAPRLRRDQRLALGMRLGDRLPTDAIAAVLGRSVTATRAMLAAALARVVEECFPGRELTELDPDALDSYVSDLLDGTPPEAVAPRELSAVLDALLQGPAPEPLTPTAEETMWGRYEEEQDEYLPGRPLPTAPRWLAPVLAVVGLFLALAAGSLWVLARAPLTQETQTAAPAPTTTPRPRIAGARAPSRPTEPRPQYTPGAERGVLGELSGRLYYVDSRQGYKLVHTNLDSPTSAAAPRMTLALRQGPLRYAVSPVSEQIAYSSGRGIWLQDAEAGTRRLLLLRRDGTSTDESNVLEVRALAWHPQGHTLAFVDEPPYSRPGPQMLYTYTPGVDSVLGPPVAALPLGDQVSELSWSPDGEYVLANTGGGALVVRPRAPGRPATVPFFMGNRDAQWSPDPRTPRILWTDKKWPGSDGAFGVVEVATRRSRTLGRASYASWQPDGTQVIYTRFGNRSGAGTTVWLLNLKTEESYRIAHLPELQAPVSQVEFAPDGIHLAYTSPSGVWVANYFTGQTVQLPGATSLVHRLSWLPTAHGPAAPEMDERGTVLYVEERLGSDGTAPRRRQQSLVALDMQTGTRTELHAGASLRFAVSPYHTLALVAVDNRLEMLNLETGEVTRLTQVERGQVVSPAWLPPTSGVVYLEHVYSAEGGLHQVHLVRQDLRTGRRSVLLRAQYRQAPVSVFPSPSGRWLLLSGRTGWSLLPVGGGKPRGLAPAISYEWRPGGHTDQLLRSGTRDEVVDVGGKVLHRLPVGTGRARWANPDHVLTVTTKQGAVLYNVRTRKSAPAHPLPQQFKFAPFSPSGRWMLESASASLWAQDVHTGKRKWVASGDGGFGEPVWISNRVKPKPPVSAPRSVPPARGRPALFFREVGDRSAFQGLWMHEPGREPERVARVSGYDLSPGGGQAVYADQAGLWMTDLHAGEERLVLPFEDGKVDAYTRLSDPQWSPDGSLISFLVTPRSTNYLAFSYLPLGVFLVNAESGKMRGHLVFGSEQSFAQGARWSAGGRSVLVSSLGHTTEYDLERQQLGVLPFGQTVAPQPSPLHNDRSLLYVERAQGMAGAVRIRHDNGELYTLSKLGHSPIWSPHDASVYLFEGSDLWWVSRNGKYRWRIAQNLPGATAAVSPVWAPDGTLTYAAGNTVWSVDLTTGKARRLLQWRSAVHDLAWGRLPSETAP